MFITIYSAFAVFVLFSIELVVGSEECPPWFTLENTTGSLFPQCFCSTDNQPWIICDQRLQKSYLNPGNCAFQDTTTNGTLVAACPYVFPKHLIVDGHILLPSKVSELNNFTCGNLHRDLSFPLCGRCANGTGPAIYYFGSKCVPCSAVNILYYLLLQYLPNTIMFLAIIVFRINITAAPMVHYVLFCNVVVLALGFFSGEYSNIMLSLDHKYIYIKNIGRLLLTLNAVWTFDILLFLSPPLCISEHMQEIYIPYLNTLAALYPFILLLITYAAIQLHAHDYKLFVRLWKLFHRTYVRFRRAWDPNASMIQAFATVLFLSYTKFLLLMYEPFRFSNTYNQKLNSVNTTMYLDPNIPINDPKHIYLFLLSAIIFIFILLPPSLLLIIFPTRLFSKVSQCLKLRWIISIRIFADTFNGCYKDGTDGARDYRAVSGYILATCLLIPTIHIVMTLQDMATLIPSVYTTLFIVLTVPCAAMRPYKHTAANISGVALLAILALLAFSFQLFLSHNKFAVILNIATLALPHCVFYSYLVYQLGKLAKQRCLYIWQEREHTQRLCRFSNTGA